MVVALERALAAGGRSALTGPGGTELARALGQAIGHDCPATLVAEEPLKPWVFRLVVQSGGRILSTVAKRMAPEHALRNQLAIRRWMPELELGDMTPELLGVAATDDGAWVWHVYQDLGPFELESRAPDRARVEAAARRIATLHARGTGHPLLAECRLHGVPRGSDLFATTVGDALSALAALRAPGLTPGSDAAELCDRLTARLQRLLDEAPTRTRAIVEWGGPDTLQHGDLWATNTFVEPSAGGLCVRLIDWDRAGVGSASYDLSTFLLRFAPAHRPWIVTAYREALGAEGWRMPGRKHLNLLFETDELARYANRIIWPARAIVRERAAWGFDELAAVEGWFEALRPVLPEETA